MAAYDYRCRICGSTFEVHRPVTAATTAPTCPAGHTEVSRMWSAVALTGAASGPASGGGGGGGCCGGACGCR